MIDCTITVFKQVWSRCNDFCYLGPKNAHVIGVRAAECRSLWPSKDFFSGVRLLCMFFWHETIQCLSRARSTDNGKRPWLLVQFKSCSREKWFPSSVYPNFYEPKNHSEMSQVSWETWVAWVPNHWETHLKAIRKLFVIILARAVPAEVFHFNMCCNQKPCHLGKCYLSLCWVLGWKMDKKNQHSWNPEKPAFEAVPGPLWIAAVLALVQVTDTGNHAFCMPLGLRDSSWCWDWTSNPGTWGHVGARFPLRGRYCTDLPLSSFRFIAKSTMAWLSKPIHDYLCFFDLPIIALIFSLGLTLCLACFLLARTAELWPSAWPYIARRHDVAMANHGKAFSAQFPACCSAASGLSALMAFLVTYLPLPLHPAALHAVQGRSVMNVRPPPGGPIAETITTSMMLNLGVAHRSCLKPFPT